MFRPAVVLALSLGLVACGSRVGDANADGGPGDAALDTNPPSTRPDRPEFSCPSSPPSDAPHSCYGTGSTCVYPCAPGNPNKRTFLCDGGIWKPTSYCEPPAVAGSTVGDPCTTHEECDRTGDGTHYCTLNAFAGSSSYPTPVCIASDCTVGVGPLTTCDGTRGLCFDTGATGICLPRCTFGNDGAPAKGCLGRNMCWPVARADASQWWGQCAGGCTADADCPTGNRCDPDRLVCVKTIAGSTKTFGEPCDTTDASTGDVCMCMFSRSTSRGYCSKVCRVGETSCPSGSVCDPMLPSGDAATIPAGIGGHCQKVCESDGDCVNSKCEQHAGLSVKTCSVDWRP